MSLTELPDPPDTEAGWKLDPTGVGDWRWWNGKNWVAEVAGKPAGKPTMWSRYTDLPLWARWVLPLAAVALFTLETVFMDDSALDIIWWFWPPI